MEGGSNEQVDLAPGRTYVAYLDLFEAPSGPVAAPVHSWIVPDEPAGNLTLTPSSSQVTPGSTHTVTAAWSGLDPDSRYLGTVDYLAEGALLTRTIVAVNF